MMFRVQVVFSIKQIFCAVIIALIIGCNSSIASNSETISPTLTATKMASTPIRTKPATTSLPTRVLNVTGTPTEPPITPTVEVEQTIRLAWATNSFSNEDFDKPQHIWMLELPSQTQTLLVERERALFRFNHLTWSKDGEAIAFVHQVDDITSSIAIYDLTQKRLIRTDLQVTMLDTEDDLFRIKLNPNSWSADNQWLTAEITALDEDSGIEAVHHYAVIDAVEGKTIKHLAKTIDFIGWHPSEKDEYVYLESAESQKQLYQASVNDSPSTLIPLPNPLQNSILDGVLAPNGVLLAYRFGQFKYNAENALINLETQEIKYPAANGTPLFWSSDSRWLLLHNGSNFAIIAIDKPQSPFFLDTFESPTFAGGWKNSTSQFIWQSNTKIMAFSVRDEMINEVIDLASYPIDDTFPMIAIFVK